MKRAAEDRYSIFLRNVRGLRLHFLKFRNLDGALFVASSVWFTERAADIYDEFYITGCNSVRWKSTDVSVEHIHLQQGRILAYSFFCSTFWPWKWRLHFPSQLRLTFSALQGVEAETIWLFFSYRFENLRFYEGINVCDICSLLYLCYALCSWDIE